MDEVAWGWFSIVLCVIGYTPYFFFILKGKTKPHAFSWFIWAVLTAIAFFAQVADDAGPGAWATGLTAAFSFLFAGLALFRGEKNITRSDWLTFITALMTIPLWYVTRDPLSAIVLISLIDVLAFYPTFRKSWHKPHEEMTFSFGLSAFKFGVSLLAMNNMTWTTALYPWSLVLMNGLFVAMVWMRRRQLSRAAATESQS